MGVTHTQPTVERADGIPASPSKAEDVYVLDEDCELGRQLSAEAFAVARRYATARVETLKRGEEPDFQTLQEPALLGLLVLDGLLTRDVACSGRECVELLGRGDLLRPWDYSDGLYAPVPFEDRWRVIEPTRLAVLDRRFALVAGRFPELQSEIIRRALHRSRWLSLLFALSHVRRIDHRLLALLWHLADRWGQVEREGVVLPLRLTHEALAKLAGARRPSVTLAMSQLREKGEVVRSKGGQWLLQGTAPDATLLREP